MADEVVYVFIGFLGGVSLGLVCGWLLAQIVLSKPSTVVIQKLDNGYVIRES